MSREGKVCIGVVAATPLRSFGLTAILEEALEAEVVPLERDASGQEEDLDALLLDLHAPLETILYVVARIREQQPELKILVMGGVMPMEDIQALVSAGVKGFLLETAAESEIRMAMEVILDGSIWGPRKVLARLIEEKSANTDGKADPALPVEKALSARELEVLHLLMKGRSNREIAGVLGVGEATVKAHVGKMLHKTCASNRVELSLRALREQKSKKKAGY